MKRAAGLLAALALAAGCGGSPSAEDVLAETAQKLGEIESGELSLRVVASAEGEEVGFELEGPFALAEKEDALPVAELEYTQLAAGEEATVTLISTGEKAFVRIGEETFELPAEQLEELRGAGAALEPTAGLEELEIGEWFEDPELEDGGEVGGDETDRVRSRLDVVAAANDLVALFLEDGAPRLEGESARQLERAVESATVEVYTGKEDRLLRRLAIDAVFEAKPPPELEEALGRLPTPRFTLDLTIANPNREVTVEEPQDAEPFPGE